MGATAIIPARGGSKGLPRKNLATVGGIPLIVRAVKAAAGARAINQIYVSTDDAEIAAVSSAQGAHIIRRPAALSGDFASSEAALAHALSQIEKEEKHVPSIFSFIQCTSPFICSADLDAAIAQLEENKADCVFSAVRCPYFLWQKKKNGTVKPIGHSSSRLRERRQQRKPQFAETGAFYIIRTATFMQAETRNRFCGHCEIFEISEPRSLEIDDLQDLVRARRISSEFSADFTFPENIRAIVSDFDGVLTDNRVLLTENGLESVVCNRGDGLALERLCSRFSVLVLSAEVNPVVAQRCKKLGVDCLQGEKSKTVRLAKWLQENGFGWEHTAYLGNDDNDLECLEKAALGIAPADSSPRALAAADVVLPLNGGEGIMRIVAQAAKI